MVILVPVWIGSSSLGNRTQGSGPPPKGEVAPGRRQGSRVSWTTHRRYSGFPPTSGSAITHGTS